MDYFEISIMRHASWSDIYLYFTFTSQKASTEIFTLAQTVWMSERLKLIQLNDRKCLSCICFFIELCHQLPERHSFGIILWITVWLFYHEKPNDSKLILRRRRSAISFTALLYLKHWIAHVYTSFSHAKEIRKLISLRGLSMIPAYYLYWVKITE